MAPVVAPVTAIWAGGRSINSPPGRTPPPVTVLRNIEQKIESLFEGVFSRAFRTHVQPVELARKLAKEMDDHRMIPVSRVYAPNEYSVYLSPTDREQFETYEESLVTELQEWPRCRSSSRAGPRARMRRCNRDAAARSLSKGAVFARSGHRRARICEIG